MHRRNDDVPEINWNKIQECDWMAKKSKGNKYYVGNPNRHVSVNYTAVQFMMLFYATSEPLVNKYSCD